MECVRQEKHRHKGAFTTGAVGKIASLVKIKGFGLKEKRLSRSVFFFFTAGSRPIGPVQFLYLRLAFIQKGIAPGAKRLQIEHITQRVN